MHGHHHHHHDDTANLKVAFLLNLIFTVIELVGGLLTNSVAILSDALHDLGDTLSLALAWFLDRYSRKESDKTYSYGYRRFSLLGAFINSVVLIGGSLFVLTEAVERLMTPEPFDERGMILIALLGIGANGVAVLRLRGSESLNAQVIGWHLVEDVLGWVAVLIVGVVSLFVDLPILDPILSVLIMLYILVNALSNLRKTVALFLQATPQHIDLRHVEARLGAIHGVESTHHTHIWSLDGEHNVLTTHLVVDENTPQNELLRIKRESRQAVQDLHLEHATIEIEFGCEDCSMETEAVHG